MTRCLILGIDHPVAQQIAEQLTDITVVGFAETAVAGLSIAEQFNGDARKAKTYLDAVRDVDVIYADFIGMDVDWKLEAVFAAIRETGTECRTVMRSVAGIDNEVTAPLTYAGITDTAEFLKQQRYAIKIVDEAELPYTILRPVAIDPAASGAVQLINEGDPVPASPVSEAAFVQVAVDEILHSTHLNQSIAVVSQ